MRIAAKAAIVSHGHPPSRCPSGRASRVSIGVFPASETFPARRARTPERAFASEIETKPCFSVTVGFMGSIFTIRELGAVHGDATAAKRYRPHIVARTANVNE